MLSLIMGDRNNRDEAQITYFIPLHTSNLKNLLTCNKTEGCELLFLFHFLVLQLINSVVGRKAGLPKGRGEKNTENTETQKTQHPPLNSLHNSQSLLFLKFTCGIVRLKLKFLFLNKWQISSNKILCKKLNVLNTFYF